LSVLELTPGADVDGARVWAGSGAMALTGRADGPPLAVPDSVGSRLVGLADALARTSARVGRTVDVDGPALLGERAAFTGNARNGSTSVGGTCRLLRTADGWIAVNLARPVDLESVPAWLGVGVGDDPWPAIEECVLGRGAVELAEGGGDLGLPVGALGERAPTEDVAIVRKAGSLAARPGEGFIVVDLSSLWAGPLAANLLGLSGARVIKVESVARADGARLGVPGFFDLLHGGHESVAVDFRTADGRRALRSLVERADVVIEASRPRAFEQLGIAAEQVLATSAVRVWLSITAYGRDGPAGGRVGFGDDAAVAGGLVAWDDEGPCFAGDAAADPATGLLGATVVLDRLATGGRWLVDLALSRTAAWLAGSSPAAAAVDHPVAPPRARPVSATAAPLGAHTTAVLTEFGIEA
jgi:crotonobetainyl-CoA:carnitine CoA-transferase CaiB-like acyl-CoA transferase